MDFDTDIDQILKDLEWEEFSSTLTEVVMDLLDETPIPTPPLPSPPVTAVLESKNYPEAVESMSRGYGGKALLEAAPHGFEQPQPFVDTSPHQSNDVAMVHLPEHVTQNLSPVGYLNGEVVYMCGQGTLPDRLPAASQLKIRKPKKKKHQNKYHDWPYIKKPLNSFMIYMKEQRAKVVAETNIRLSATINKILGQRWKLLPKEEKARYYEESVKANLLHILHHPDWSARLNYGKYRCKGKKTRTQARSKTTESLSPRTIAPFPAEEVVMPSPHTQNEVMVPVCPIHYNMYCPAFPATAWSNHF